jgi:hypothetical protein
MIDSLPLRTSRTADAVALACALLGAAAVSAGLYADASRTWANLLLDGFYFLSLALAGLVFLAIQYLSSAGWWSALRRVPEALMALVPLAALPMLGVFLGRRALYPWTAPGALRGPELAAKAAYLNPPFFLARMLLFLGLWSLFAVLLRRASLAQDREPGLAQHRRMVRFSAIFIVLFAVSFSLASFDWLMSLEPRWASTIFAVYTFAGLFQAGLAAITLIVVLLYERGPLADVVNANHLHDLGKLLFAFSTFWAYIWVSQYLLIWYGNLSEEIPYYVERTHGGWLPLFVLNPVLNWLVPFVVLLPRAAKRSPTVLKWVAALLLVGHWVNLYLAVAPPVLHRPRLGALELLIAAGFAGLFAFAVARALRRAPILAVNDPFLAESLEYQQ